MALPPLRETSLSHFVSVVLVVSVVFIDDMWKILSILL